MSIIETVVDTNVAIVANEGTEQAGVVSLKVV